MSADELTAALAVLGVELDAGSDGVRVTFRGKDGGSVTIGPVPPEYVARDFPVPTNPYEGGGAGVVPYGICVRRPDSDPHRAAIPQESWIIPFFGGGLALAISDFARWFDGDFEAWVRTFSIRHGRYSANRGAELSVGNDQDSGGLFATARYVEGPNGTGPRYVLLSAKTWRPEAQDHGDILLHVSGRLINNPNAIRFLYGDIGVGEGLDVGKAREMARITPEGISTGGYSTWKFFGTTREKNGQLYAHAKIGGRKVKWRVEEET